MTYHMGYVTSHLLYQLIMLYFTYWTARLATVDRSLGRSLDELLCYTISPDQSVEDTNGVHRSTITINLMPHVQLFIMPNSLHSANDACDRHAMPPPSTYRISPTAFSPLKTGER